MATENEKRSVILDIAKVRKLALNEGYNNLDLFKAAFCEYLGKKEGDNIPTAPSNAWNGRPIDKPIANGLAIFLGEKNYFSLLRSSPLDIIFPEKREWNIETVPPGSLLKAEYGIVPFHQRQEELEELNKWCMSDNRLSVRLYTGAGGMGKTRLAIEQCHRLKKMKSHWEAGFLNYISQSGGDSRFRWLDTEDRSIFVVMDYAETHTEEVVEFLQAAIRSKTKVRVLLLARSAANWWDILKTENKGVGDLLMSQSSRWIMLQPMLLDDKSRQKSWTLAADKFAHHLGKGISMNLPDQINLKSRLYDRVLLLHMQALLSIDEESPEDSQASILEVILKREKMFWVNQLKTRSLPSIYIDAISIAVARVSLIKGIYHQKDAYKLLDEIPILEGSKGHEKQEIIGMLHELYSSNLFSEASNESNKYIEPLQPDILGEYHIANELEKNKNQDIILNFPNSL